MPWTTKDVDRHKKGLSDKQKETWVKVANAALKRCLGEGRSQGDCEGSAIRQANKVAGNMKEYKAHTTSTNDVLISVNAIDVDGEAVPVAELVAAYEEQRGQGQGVGGPRQGDGGANVCVCPECDHEVEHEKGTPCNEMECPECGTAMVGKQEEMSEAVWTTAFVNDLPDSSFAVIMPGGEKDEEGKTKPRSLRKLPYKDAGGKVDIPHLRNALARLKQMKGVSAELKAKALKKLQSVAKKHLKTYQAEMEAVALAVALAESFEIEIEEEMAEAQLSESASGHAIALAEAQAVTSGPRAPLLMDVALIKPGWGNKKDNHYYPREVLARDARIFEGIKMYATDHRPDEKSVRTEVAVIKTCPVAFTDDGAPIAQVAVHDGDFAEQARNRAKLGTLGTLECSILATGRTKKGKIDGQKANIVEAITKGQSVDWVTKAGAGGHAIALAENETGGVNMMDKERIEQLLSESDLPQDVQERLAGAEYENEEAVKEAILAEAKEGPDGDKPEVTYLAEAEVKEVLEASRLPKQAQGRLAEGQYLDAEALKAAIEQERAYIKEITGSGKPFAQGGGTAPGEEQMSEADYDAAYADILGRHGVHVPQRQEA